MGLREEVDEGVGVARAASSAMARKVSPGELREAVLQLGVGREVRPELLDAVVEVPAILQLDGVGPG